MLRSGPAFLALLVFAAASAAEAQSLRGSPAKMQRQNLVARQHDYSFLRTSADVRRFIDLGLLVPVRGNADYTLANVSFPYARPAVRTFVERLAMQYRNACGERLVVTSLTRPLQNQPRNASALSVHPAGMAVDLRVPANGRCRQWLENTLLSLDRQSVISATRENFPPHYHIAVYPTPYLQYVARITGSGTAVAQAAQPRSGGAASPATTAAARPTAAEAEGVVATAAFEGSDAPASSEPETPEVRQIRVNRGDTLWSIARRSGTTVDEIKALNNLRTSRIVAGQMLAVPTP